MKKIIITILSVVLAFSSVSCAKDKASTIIEVWSAPSMEKILQDKTYESKGDMKIDVSLFKNEYENAQIIITPNKNIGEYTLTTNNLKMLDGDSNIIFDKNNIEVFNQKYIEVKTKTSQISAFELGMYPDALLPFDKAVEYKENKIKANNNQAVYFQFYAPYDAIAGEYNGNFNLDVDGKDYIIPVKMTIYDYALEDNVNSKTLFGLDRHPGEGGIVTAEKDASYEMFGAYYDYLLNNRLSPSWLPANRFDVDKYVEQIVKYSTNPKFSNYVIPFKEAWDSEAKTNGIDYEFHKKYLNAIANASIKENRNLFTKASTYFYLFDEADTPSEIAMANNILKKVYALQESIANEWRTSLKCDAKFKNELISSMLNTTQLYVTYYQEEFTAGGTYCPQVDRYNIEEERKNYDKVFVYNEGEENEYRQNAEKWWYTCLTPRNPYPTYHIDDWQYSPRILSWMQSKYNVVGNLYWSTVFYYTFSPSTGNVPLQDYYDTAMRFNGDAPANGDGFLLYPGSPYGIYGPVGSLRLNSVRDGQEDYDLLAQFKKKYAGVENNIDNVLQLLYGKLFSGTKISASVEKVETARNELMQLLVLSDKGVLLTDATSKGNILEIKAKVSEGVSIKSNCENVKNGNEYIFSIPLNKDINTFDITAKTDGREYKLSINLGGKMVSVNPKDLLNQFSDLGNKGAMNIDDSTKFNGMLKVSLNASSSIQSLTLDSSDLALNSKTKNLILRIYIDSETDFSALFLDKNSIASPIYKTTLKSGWNDLSIDLSTLNWTAFGAGVEKISFDIGKKNDNKDRVLYFDSISTIKNS